MAAMTVAAMAVAAVTVAACPGPAVLPAVTMTSVVVSFILVVVRASMGMIWLSGGVAGCAAPARVA